MRRIIKGLFVAGTLVSFALADVELKLTDGTNSVVINSSGGIVSQSGSVSTIVSAGGAGVITWDGSIGNYNVNVTTGQGSPTLPAASMDLNSADTASGTSSGPLMILFSENHIMQTSPGWNLSFGGTLSSGTGASVTYKAFEANSSTFFDEANPIGPGLGPFGPGAFSGSNSGAVAGVTADYTLTQEIDLNGVGSTVYSGDAMLDPVPEPAAVALFGGVLLFTVTAIRRKVRRTA